MSDQAAMVDDSGVILPPPAVEGVRDARGQPVTLDTLQQLAPELCAATRVRLFAKLRRLQARGEVVDSASFECFELDETTPEMQQKVQLIDYASGKQLLTVTFENEVLYPHLLLPDRRGVDMRGVACEYETAPIGHLAEVAAAVKERADSIAHCRKLLRDLPVALANSLAALQAHVTAVDVELSDLGAMVLEQARIKQEVETQKIKLAELEASPIPHLDKCKLVTQGVQTMIYLRFGLNRLGDQLILVTRSPDGDSSAQPAVIKIAKRVPTPSKVD